MWRWYLRYSRWRNMHYLCWWLSPLWYTFISIIIHSIHYSTIRKQHVNYVVHNIIHYSTLRCTRVILHTLLYSTLILLLQKWLRNAQRIVTVTAGAMMVYVNVAEDILVLLALLVHKYTIQTLFYTTQCYTIYTTLQYNTTGTIIALFCWKSNL